MPESMSQFRDAVQAFETAASELPPMRRDQLLAAGTWSLMAFLYGPVLVPPKSGAPSAACPHCGKPIRVILT